MEDKHQIDLLIEAGEKELAELDSRRSILIDWINKLEKQKPEQPTPTLRQKSEGKITRLSPQDEKIALFRFLFRGRQDVFPKRFESKTTGKSGYQPACRNEWKAGICQKPKIKCSACDSRDLFPVSDEIIRNHLLGSDPKDRIKRDFIIGVYPLLEDESCWFLAADFDKDTWKEDVSAFMETCKSFDVPVALERSRSGNGGHAWIIFSEPVPPPLARKLGSFIITQTMERRPEIGLKSYDSFFPKQDIMPKGGFGNLIALPLQKRSREKGNSVFLDENFIPYDDQWAFLASIRRMSFKEVEVIIDKSAQHDESDNKPWLEPPSRRKKEIPIKGPLPDHIDLVLENQIYIEKRVLPPALLNRLIRVAAFQNPEFYKAQAMRFSTHGKPRIINCCEDFPGHIGIPIGCLDEVVELLKSFKIEAIISDERFSGVPIDPKFSGTLTPDQQSIVIILLAHDTGVLSASTGFGKTVIAINLISARKVNTLILVHRKELLEQWIDRLIYFLGIDPKNIGQIGGGKRKPTGVIDVAMIQSLSKKGEVDDSVGEYGHLIVDECHHISAPSFEIVAKQCKAKYITGLSATVVRKDGHHPIIFMNCGPLRYKVDDRKQAETRPFEHKVIIRDTGFNLPESLKGKESAAIHELYAALMADDDRNAMIIEDVVKSVKANRSPIVLTERKAHIEILSDLLSPLVRNVFVLKGGMGKKQRRNLFERMDAVSDDEERVIIATGRYLGEGFDDARLDTLFLTLPVSWKGILNQYAGRLHRLHDLKTEVIIYDYADLEVPMLDKMYRRRLGGYNAIGYEINS